MKRQAGPRGHHKGYLLVCSVNWSATQVWRTREGQHAGSFPVRPAYTLWHHKGYLLVCSVSWKCHPGVKDQGGAARWLLPNETCVYSLCFSDRHFGLFPPFGWREECCYERVYTWLSVPLPSIPWLCAPQWSRRSCSISIFDVLRCRCTVFHSSWPPNSPTGKAQRPQFLYLLTSAGFLVFVFG